jgi:hypothetical protein
MIFSIRYLSGHTGTLHRGVESGPLRNVCRIADCHVEDGIASWAEVHAGGMFDDAPALYRVDANLLKERKSVTLRSPRSRPSPLTVGV